jgi:hypothetical protein
MLSRTTVVHATFLATLVPPLVPGLGGCSGGESDGTGTATLLPTFPTTDPTTGDVPTTGDDTEGEPGEFGDEMEFVLRLNDDPVPPLVLEMNKQESAELFGADARDIQLIEVDSQALLENTLDQIKTACGTAWKLDNKDPAHDCDLTPSASPSRAPTTPGRPAPSTRSCAS